MWSMCSVYGELAKEMCLPLPVGHQVTVIKGDGLTVVEATVVEATCNLTHTCRLHLLLHFNTILACVSLSVS